MLLWKVALINILLTKFAIIHKLLFSLRSVSPPNNRIIVLVRMHQTFHRKIKEATSTAHREVDKYLIANKSTPVSCPSMATNILETQKADAGVQEYLTEVHS